MVGMEGLLFIDTMLEYYLGIEVGDLPDEVWAQKFRYLRDIREMESKANSSV